jgi:hypothetical protein
MASAAPAAQNRSWEPPLALLGHELVAKLLARLAGDGEAAWVSALAAELATGAAALRGRPAALRTLAGVLALPALPDEEAVFLAQARPCGPLAGRRPCARPPPPVDRKVRAAWRRGGAGRPARAVRGAPRARAADLLGRTRPRAAA